MNSFNGSSVIKSALALLALSLSMIVASAETKEEYRKSVPLEYDGQVSIGNINGSIEVSGWDREEVSVVAIKKGKTPEIVEGIEIIIESDINSFVLKTKLPKLRSWFFGSSSEKGNVAYKIKVPYGASLQKISSVNGAISIEELEGNVSASTVNGSLKVYELVGDVDLSAVNGSVRASYSEAPKSDSIHMKVVNGSVTLEIPNDTNAYFTANTVNGGIRSDIDIPVTKSFPIGAHLKGQQGEGGPKISLKSVNGRISIEEG